MTSKKQAAFSQRVLQEMARRKIKQRQIADYLGIASSSVSRKLNGKHPWTVDEQDQLTRWLRLESFPADPRPCRDEDPTLEAMEQVILGITRQQRTEVYRLVVSVTRGLLNHMTPSGQEAYRAFCAMVG